MPVDYDSAADGTGPGQSVVYDQIFGGLVEMERFVGEERLRQRQEREAEAEDLRVSGGKIGGAGKKGAKGRGKGSGKKKKKKK